MASIQGFEDHSVSLILAGDQTWNPRQVRIRLISTYDSREYDFTFDSRMDAETFHHYIKKEMLLASKSDMEDVRVDALTEAMEEGGAP